MHNMAQYGYGSIVLYADGEASWSVIHSSISYTIFYVANRKHLFFIQRKSDEVWEKQENSGINIIHSHHQLSSI